MRFINLCPHAINIVRPEGAVSFPPSGRVARIKFKADDVDPVLIGHVQVPVEGMTVEGIDGLPDADTEGETIYIVSAMVRMYAQAKIGRTDVVSPGGLVRDEDGRVVGCTKFVR